MRKFKSILKRSILLASALTLLLSAVVYAQTWEYRFPTSIQDTSGVSRPYYPALLGYGGTALVDAGKINADGLDTNMQIGSSDIKYMLATAQTGVVLPSYPAGGLVTTNLYTGYAPAQTEFPIIVGEGGYITTPDAAALEPADDFDFEFDAFVDTSVGTDKYLVFKDAAFETYVDEASEISARIPSYDLSIEQAVVVGSLNVRGVNWYAQTFTAIGNDPSNLGRVGINLLINGAPVGDFTVEIRATAAGLPTGDALTSVMVNANTLGVGWNYFDFDLDMSLGTVYAVVVSHPVGVAPNWAAWRMDNTNPYAGGQQADSVDSGVTWAAVPADDTTFRIYTNPKVTASSVTSADMVVTTDLAPNNRPDIGDYATDANIAVNTGAGILPVRLLEEQELAIDTASITFSDIDVLVSRWDTMAGVTSRHLVIIVNAASPDAVAKRAVEIQINGDAGANYNHQTLTGEAAVADADIRTGVNALFEYPGGTDYPFSIPGTTYANAFGGGTILFPHAFNIANHKVALAFGGVVEDYVSTVVGRWASINAITSLVLVPDTGNFATGSSFILGVVDERYLVEEDNLVGDGTITFAAIPGTGDDLVVIGYARSDRAARDDRINHEINDDVGANYDRQYLVGSGSSVEAAQGADQRIGFTVADTGTVNAFGAFLVSYSQYAEVANDPHYLSLAGYHESISSIASMFIFSGRRNNVAAITKLEYYPELGTNFKAGTLFSLYRVPRFTIDRQELAAPAATITFTNIPQGYEALQLLVYARSDLAALNENIEITINADAVAANYDFQELTGTGVVVAAARNPASQVVMVIPAATEGANEFGGGITTLTQYARTDGHKPWITLSGTNENQVIIRSSRRESNNAITRIDLDLAGANNFIAGSVFELVGWMPSKEFQISIDGEIKGATDGNGISVPANANDWIWNQNEVMPYIDSAKEEVSGAAVLEYEPDGMVGGTDYVVGNAVFTNASATVTGVGTVWDDTMVNGAIMYDADALWVHILSVESATSLTLTAVYAGAGGAAAAYTMATLIENNESAGLYFGIVTWGTNTNTTVTYGEMVSFESTTASATAEEGFEMPTSPLPSTWFASGENVANLPLYDVLNSIALDMGMQVQMLYFWWIIGLAFGVALLLMIFTRSALFGVMGMTIVLFIGSSMTIIPMWMPVIILVVDIGIMYLYRQVSY